MLSPQRLKFVQLHPVSTREARRASRSMNRTSVNLRTWRYRKGRTLSLAIAICNGRLRLRSNVAMTLLEQLEQLSELRCIRTKQ